MYLFNPTPYDIKGMFDGVVHTIPANEAVIFPEDIGRHLIYKCRRLGLVEATTNVVDPNELVVRGFTALVKSLEAQVAAYEKQAKLLEAQKMPNEPKTEGVLLAEARLPKLRQYLDSVRSEVESAKQAAEAARVDELLKRPPKLPSFDDLSVEQLRGLCTERGVKFDFRDKTKTLIAKLKEAEAQVLAPEGDPAAA